MFHIISDLRLDLYDLAPEQNIVQSGTTYIIITGNVSNLNKRSLILAENLSKKHPNSFIIFNYGILEGDACEWSKIYDGFEAHLNDFKKSGKNVYHPSKGAIIGDYDFYCTIGWPSIIDARGFKESKIGSGPRIALNQDFYIDDILMTSEYPRHLNLEFIEEKVAIEKENIQKWVKDYNGYQKILVTSFGNTSNSYMGSMSYKIFPDVDLTNTIWICGGDRDFLGEYNGARVICLPGLDRSRYLTEKDFKLI